MIIEVTVAAIAAFAFGAAWYMSPIGKAWLASRIWDDKDNEKWQSGKYMAMMYGTSIVLTAVVAYVLNVIFTVLQLGTLTEYLYVAWLICFGFVVTIKFSDMLYTNTPPFWGRRAQTVFLVDALYNVGVFTILAVVLFYL
jgi:hypothetical protein